MSRNFRFPISISKITALILFTAASFLMTGCGTQNTDQDLPAILKIGVLPDESKERLIERYDPLRSYLAETLDVSCELVFTENYDGLLQSFGKGTVDIAYFGGATFVHAQNKYNAIPLIMRDIDVQFSTYFVVNANSNAKYITDFKDQKLAFGSRLSTSGHFMPRYFLADQDIQPEEFFRDVQYSGAHDRTIQWVRDGKVDIGAVNSQIFDNMLSNGNIKNGEMRILWETPPYADYVWAVQPSLGEVGQIKIRNAFLALSPDNDQHRSILRTIGAKGFIPADAEAFSILEMIMSNTESLQ